jgi:hypothetical protein
MYYFIEYIIRFIRFFFKYITFIFNKPVKKESIIDTTNCYIHKNTKLFLNYLKDDNKRNELNSNIEDIFYSNNEYNKTILDIKNKIEPKWRTNILFETTPYGNIIMFYDCFKHGFSYYSDNSFVPYVLLNTVAMKYVIKFHCFDFFIDTLITKEKESPFIKLYFTEEKKENMDNIFKVQNSHFLQKKITTTITNINKKTTQPLQQVDYLRNVFIHLGKVNNFSFIQKPIKKNKTIFHNKYIDDLDGESDLQLSYKQYKMNSKKT